MHRRALAVVSLIGMLACSSEPGSAGSSTGGSGSGSGSGGSSGTAGGGSSTGGGSTTGGSVDAGDTWTSWASPQFFQSFCVSCHRPDGQGDPSGGLDFNTYQDVSANAGLIRCGVARTQNADWNCPSNIVAKQFPIDPGTKPSNEQRDRLVDWIDAGFPQ
jgi:hypothetical protein